MGFVEFLVFGLIIAVLGSIIGLGAISSWEEKTAEKSEQEAQRAKDAEIEAIREFFDSHPNHVRVLARLYRQKVYRDEFGDLRLEEWDRTLEDYVQRKLLDEGEFGESPSLAHNVKYELWSRFDEDEDSPERDELDDEPDPSSDGLDYEEKCLALLEESGWECELTPTTGDQGVDIVGTKDGTRTAFQCKAYSQPVGNTAVQEVHAGRAFYDCQQAVVVSDAGFTRSARQLATKLHVHLLHSDDLESLSVPNRPRVHPAGVEGGE